MKNQHVKNLQKTMRPNAEKAGYAAELYTVCCNAICGNVKAAREFLNHNTATNYPRGMWDGLNEFLDAQNGGMGA
jgi:hypothetical protein